MSCPVANAPCALKRKHTEAECRCECGKRLVGHPPLPKPAPITSWQYQTATRRMLEQGESWNGRTTSGKAGWKTRVGIA